MSETALILPPALAVWGDLFADMPESHLRLIAGLITVLSPLIDKAEAAGARPRGEIDSFSGIGTRGGIERLLASEWLWRDLAPDDFLRRVAEREALTFEPVHRQAADARTVLVVLDAGPAMLGRPRLVGFAALLCLAASAKGRGARLLWSSNAMPDICWREAFTRGDVALFLDRVSATTLNDADVYQLLEAPTSARPRQKLPPSVWLIGPGWLPQEPPNAGRITIEEIPRLDPDLVIAARVEVIGPGGGPASATFDLPDEAEATALLRDPFRAPKARISPRPKPPLARADWAQSHLAFSADAAYLVVALRGGLLAVPTERSSGLVAWRVKLASYERVVGVEVTRRRLSLATATRYSTRARIVWREAELDAECPALRRVFAAELDPDHPLVVERWPRTALPPLGRQGKRERFWALTQDGEAFIVAADGALPYAPLTNGVLLKVCPTVMLVRRPNGEVFACRRKDGRTIARYRPPNFAIETATVLDVMEQDGERWLVAQGADGGWRLARAGGKPIDVPAAVNGERVVGFVPDPAAGERPAAIMIDLFGYLSLRDADFMSLADPVELPELEPPLVLMADGGEKGPWLATARLDAEGYVMSFNLGPFRDARLHDEYPVSDVLERASCLLG